MSNDGSNGTPRRGVEADRDGRAGYFVGIYIKKYKITEKLLKNYRFFAYSVI